MSRGPSNSMLIRMMWVLGLLVMVGFSTLIGRLVYLQLIENETYQQRAVGQQMRETTISAKRGSILDRNMNVLAKSASVWKVCINPKSIKDDQRQLIADTLAEILDVDADKVLEKTKMTDYYNVLIKRRVERPEEQEIRKFIADNKIKGIFFVEDYKRYYPFGDFASQVLGFTGDDHQGLSGIEAYYEKYLRGTDGVTLSAKDAIGQDMDFQYETTYNATDGYNLVLTIDEVIQHITEKHLETAVKEFNVQNKATAIVMDVKTGEVLAMATKGDYDPNEPFVIADEKVAEAIAEITDEDEHKQAIKQAQSEQWRNKAITEAYEPGSVYKIITAAAALEEGVCTAQNHYVCNGSLVVNGRKIDCWKTTGHGPESFADGIKNSCNPVFMTIGLGLGVDRTIKYYKAFGFNERTGIDLPGEGEGVYHSRAVLEKEEDTLAVASFGQSFAVSPIQVITAVSAAVNGGYLMEPHIVKQILDSDNNVVETIEPVVRRQVISNEVSEELALMLEKVVSEGSGKNAYVMGYRIAGKTGTSEDLTQKEGERKQYVSSFLGFAPADDPEIAVLVLLDDPVDSNIYGSVIAAPVAGSIISETLSYLGIEPEYTAEELSKIDISTPNGLGIKAHDATAKMSKVGLTTKYIGEGETVVKQIPALAKKYHTAER